MDSAGDLGVADAGALGSATEGVGLESALYEVYISTLQRSQCSQSSHMMSSQCGRLTSAVPPAEFGT